MWNPRSKIKNKQEKENTSVFYLDRYQSLGVANSTENNFHHIWDALIFICVSVEAFIFP